MGLLEGLKTTTKNYTPRDSGLIGLRFYLLVLRPSQVIPILSQGAHAWAAFFLMLFWNRLSACSLDWPQTHANSSALAPQVLGLQLVPPHLAWEFSKSFFSSPPLVPFLLFNCLWFVCSASTGCGQLRTLTLSLGNQADVGTDSWNPRTWEMKTWGSEVQGQVWLDDAKINK